MATMRREEQKKNNIIVFRFLAIVVCISIGIGMIIGMIIGKLLAPTKIETITVPINVPVYAEEELPNTEEEITYYNVPLSHSLQNYISEICADEGVPMSLVIAMIDHESKFDSTCVSSTDDYGLMQINQVNMEELESQYHCADMMNPYQNVFCGIKIMAGYIEKFDGNYAQALMAYNLGEYGATNAIADGITTTNYSSSIMKLMNEYEQEVQNAV